jgi:hypothetical protein
MNPTRNSTINSVICCVKFGIILNLETLNARNIKTNIAKKAIIVDEVITNGPNENNS